MDNKASHRARRPPNRASVAAYLAAAFAVTIVALSAVVYYTSSSAFERERGRAVEKARSAARLVAISYGREITDTVDSSKGAMDIPDIASLDPARCNPFMQRFIVWAHGHVSVVRADGSILCSNSKHALATRRPYAGAAWLREGLAGKQIDITDPSIDPVTKKVAVGTVLPLKGATGERVVLYVLAEMPNFLTLTMPELRMGTEILVLDRDRRLVLDRSTDGSRYEGMSIAGGPLSKPIPQAGAIVRGVDGVQRVYAEQSVKKSGWRVLSGIPTAIAFAQARAQRTRSIGLGVASIGIVLVLGFALHRRLAKPIRSLTTAIEAAGADPDARAIEAGPAEVARMAATFNEMIDARRRSEARFRALVKHASDIIAVIEDDGSFRYTSPAVSAIVGDDVDSLSGRRLTDLVMGDDRERVSAAIEAARMRPGLSDPIEFGLQRTDGGVRQVEALFNNLREDEAVGGIVATIRDITERKAFEEHLAHQALHDPLTELPNRALVLDRLTHALARTSRNDGTIGVFFLDLDRFKLINDSQGHAVGDLVLVTLADRLLGAVRPADTVARFGGDEFVALCENLEDEADALRVADRLSQALRDPFHIRGQDLFISGSIGIALSGRGETAEELMRNADAAMYRAKELGRGGHAIFDDAMRMNALSRVETEGLLHRAIEREWFTLHYQPKISLTNGALVGVEALIRISLPGRGLVSPGEFIAVAEETGLIVPIGELALREACAAALGWVERTGKAVPVSVNISPRQLAQPSLPEVVERIIGESGIAPELLVLEITENLLMQDAQLARATLERLRAVGVRVSIDDFGTGHSSLGYLNAFPIDELKIDRSFVDALESDPRAGTIIGSVVGLAHAMGMSVVAEGVETAAQLSELRHLGCDEAQGFYFSHPRPADALEELLASDAIWGARPVALRQS